MTLLIADLGLLVYAIQTHSPDAAGMVVLIAIFALLGDYA